MKSLRLRLFTLIGLTLLAIYAISPTVIYFSMPKEIRNDEAELKKRLPSWLPQKHIKLGLDIQGGVQLVLGVDTAVAVDNKLGRLGTEISRWANEKTKRVKAAYAVKGEQTLRIELEDGVNEGDLKVEVAKEFPGLKASSKDGNRLDFKYEDSQVDFIRNAALEQAERVVRNRIDKWGVSEISISRRADKSIMVQMPGFKDPEKARELLGKTAQLSFKLVDEEFKGFDSLVGKLPPEVTSERRGNSGVVSLISENKQAILDLTKGLVPEGRELLFEEEILGGGKKIRYTTHVLKATTELSGEDVLDATTTYDPNSLDQRPAVSLKFTGTGGKRFADITGENIQKRMAIVLDNVVVSDPVINQRISGGSAQITMGNNIDYNKTVEEANQLAMILKSGALPAPITIMEERQVGATLGPELANQGIVSAGVGLMMVFAFMIFYYRRPGIFASIALLLNAVFLLSLMAILGFALTLPGFAGFILTLGMAVDANVLINERIREELRLGRSGRKALENGFTRVFWTIIDSNMTSLIAAFVLLETNSGGPVKGFAVALITGLLVSLYTALIGSRVMFEWAIRNESNESKIRQWLGGAAAENSRVSKFDFLKLSRPVLSIAAIFVVVVLGFVGTKGMNWSVDFAGGTEVEVLFGKAAPATELRESLEKAGLGEPTLQSVGEDQKRYLLRFEKDSKQTTETADAAAATQSLRSKLLAGLADYQPDLQRVDFVGPSIGKELRKQGIVSVIYAVIGILLYIALRFDMRFGPGLVVKMVQDVVVMLSFYAFFWRSFDLTAVAAMLTVIGYSVNDTIVIYDRIRENLTLHPRRVMYDNINVSLNETLGRSINTSLVTILSLIGLLVFGSGQIWDFAMAMVMGVISATISSTFTASSAVLWFERFKNRRTSGTPSTVSA